MAEHKKIADKNQEKVNRKHSVRQNKPQTLFDRHAWEQAAFPITGTPFQPPMGAHAELLAMAPSDKHRASLVKHLQQTYGNRYVQRLIESMNVQAKLTVSSPNDVYEQEADRVAEAVIRAADTQVQRQEAEEEEEELQAKASKVQRQEEEEEPLQTKPVDFIQRQEEEEEEEEPLQTKPVDFIQRQEEEEEEELQTKRVDSIQRQEEEEEEELQTKPSGSQPATVSENLENRIKAAQGGGHPLSDDARGPMERAFEADFSGVRVHTDSEADALNKQLSAKAFTTGEDIFFRENEYSPGSDSGRKLIAHELTHVVQQTGGTKLRPKGRETEEVSQSDDNARGTIQRKTKNIHIDKRLLFKYTKRVNVLLDQLVALINGYNSFPMNDINYDLHLAQLKAIKNKAHEIELLVERWKGFLNKKGTWRSLGGPFRLRYAFLTRNLRKLAGYVNDPGRYKGTVDKEIEKVEKQKERGLEISA